MPPLRRWWPRALALLALVAGGVGAWAAAPVGERWTADPDEQLMLDVNLHRYRLGDGVRAYPVPGIGACVVFGDFLTALDVPMKIDLAAKSASGWAFNEKNRIFIDLASGRASFGFQSEAITPGTIREVPEGWCVDPAALGRWFGLGVETSLRGSLLTLKTDQKLPVEQAIERRERAKRLQPAGYDLARLPRVRLAYRMWRTPAMEFVVASGVTYSARTGLKVDRQASLYASGEIARMSFDARVGTNAKGVPDRLRMRAYRSDPDAALLGPLKATHVALGDVDGLQTPLGGGSGQGRGAMVTNRPLAQPAAFDRKSFTGELPAGWDAEIYRNGVLLGFSEPGADQRYHFNDIQLLYGDNRFDILLHGPHGEVRQETEQINVGADSVPPGKSWYWAGVNQSGSDLVNLHHEGRPRDAGWQASAGIEHGIDRKTSVAALIQTMVVDDERLTFVEGSVRRSIGPALIELSGAYAKGGGYAARAQLLGRFGKLNVSAESVIASQFNTMRFRDGMTSEHRLSLDAPLKVGRATIPAHAGFRLTRKRDGSRETELAVRATTMIDAVMITGELDYRRQTLARGGAPPGEIAAKLFGTGRLGAVRLHGGIDWQLAPQPRFRTAELTAYWSGNRNTDWEGQLAWDGPARRARARLTHIHRFDAFALSLSAEAASDGSVAAGFNLSFALGSDWAGGGMRLADARLASAGSVSARVFRDDNNDGIRQPGEPIETAAVVTAGLRASDPKANRKGIAFVDGLQTYRPVAVGVDESSLSDPGLVPSQKLRVITPRPGVPATIDIPLIGGGDIEGVLVKSGGGGFEGLDVELVDSAGAVVQTSRSDYDGYFLFQRVAYGDYSLRLAKASADAARVRAEIGRAIHVSPVQSVIRLGIIPVESRAQLAALAP